MLLSACNQKDLCYDHWDHAYRAEVEIRAQWELEWQRTYADGTDWQAEWDHLGLVPPYDSLRPARPSGLSVIVYNTSTRYDEYNRSAEGGVVGMTPGNHQLLMYNNDTEFIVFKDMAESSEAEATTRGRSRASYVGNPMLSTSTSRTEYTVNPPDPLFGYFVDDYKAVNSPTPEVLEVTMRPLVFTYLVRYYFDHGLEYVRLARGAMAGMAEGVKLTTGYTTDEIVTVLYDCEIKDWGIEARVLSFGAPNYPNPEYSRGADEYGLNLEVRLGNGKIFNFDWNITEAMATQPRGGVIEVGGVYISDEDAKEDSGAFDVTVDDWGEWNDIPLPL